MIEIIGGVFITLGFFAGYVAFMASGEVAVAYFIGHFPQGFWPIQNLGAGGVELFYFSLYGDARLRHLEYRRSAKQRCAPLFA